MNLRPIEHRLKPALLGLLGMFYSSPYREHPIDIRLIRRILFVRNDFIGDLIVTLPVIQYLKRTYPHLSVGVFGTRENIRIIEHDPHIDFRIVASHRFPGAVLDARRFAPDALVSAIHSKQTKSALLATLLCPNGKRIGQADREHAFAYHSWLPINFSTHATDFIAQLIEHAFGITIPREELTTELFFPPSVYAEITAWKMRENIGPNFFVFNISAAAEERRYPLEQAMDVFSGLRTMLPQVTPVLVAHGKDFANASARNTELARAGIHLFPLYPTILPLAALLRDVAFIISPDSAVIHVAAAWKRNVVSLVREEYFLHHWKPYHTNSILLLPANSERNFICDIAPERIATAAHAFAKNLSLVDPHCFHFHLRDHATLG